MTTQLMRITKMRSIILLLATFMMTIGQASASDISLSIRLGQPGFYGELHFGGYYPLPQLIYPQPVLVWRTPANLRQPPIYLHVPPGHAKNWSKHCHIYNACNRYVYFVQENWYHNVYIPYYQRRRSYYEGHDNNYREPPQYNPRRYYDNDRDDHKDYRNKHPKDKPGHDHHPDKYDNHPGKKKDKDHRKD